VPAEEQNCRGGFPTLDKNTLDDEDIVATSALDRGYTVATNPLRGRTSRAQRFVQE
jgi:hypothetical protein